MWCYSFSCSSCCYLSSTCSFSQSLNRGNFWRAEKELVQQHLSSSSGADPIFLLRCQQSGRRGLGRSRLSRGCAGESCLPCLWVGELCLHEFPIRNRMAPQQRTKGSLPHRFPHLHSELLYRQAFSQAAGYHRDSIPCYHYSHRKDGSTCSDSC